MNVQLAKAFYNAAGVVPMNDPAKEDSLFAVDRIRTHLKKVIKDGVMVLDLCCGAGRFTFAVEEMGAMPIGIDCATVPLEYAKDHAKIRASKARFIEGDIKSLPFNDNYFDVVLLMDNIVEFSYKDIETLTIQLNSILKLHGKFCISLKDGLLRTKDTDSFTDGYAPLSGSIEHCYTIPNKGNYRYVTYFWTHGYVKHVIGNHLKLVTEKQLENGRCWLVFEKVAP